MRLNRYRVISQRGQEFINKSHFIENGKKGEYHRRQLQERERDSMLWRRKPMVTLGDGYQISKTDEENEDGKNYQYHIVYC